MSRGPFRILGLVSGQSSGVEANILEFNTYGSMNMYEIILKN